MAALAAAEGFLARQYQERKAGSLFEAVRWKIIDNHLQRAQPGQQAGDGENPPLLSPCSTDAC